MGPVPTSAPSLPFLCNWAWLAENAKLFNPVTTNYEQMLECLKVTGDLMYFKSTEKKRRQK